VDTSWEVSTVDLPVSSGRPDDAAVAIVVLVSVVDMVDNICTLYGSRIPNLFEREEKLIIPMRL
jgi:hypothetical protein